MRQYRVFALYDYPPIQRSALVEAVSEQQAMLRAFLEGRVPACYRRGPDGALEPVYWHPSMAGRSRWPRVTKERTLVWGDDDGGRLRFDIDPDPPPDAP